MASKWKIPQFSLFILLCLGLNIGGRELADALRLPLWLDSFGTVISAYLFGPVCGILVGISGNVLYGMAHRIPIYYALTSLFMGLVIGIAGKRKALKHFLGAMVVIGMLTFVSVGISLILNELFYNGETGNAWGNYVIAILSEYGFPRLLADGIGQFYVDFPDKMLTVLLLYAAIRIFRAWQNRNQERREDSVIPTLEDSETDQNLEVRLTSLILAFLLLGSAAVRPARAEEEALPGVDYNAYVQTVYNSANGLPCGEANDIAQTSDGILWIGTYAGLYRYNGREFRWMNAYGSIRNVNCLYVDVEGRLWVGTNDNGLSIVINEKVANVVDEGRGLPSNSVRSVIQSSDGYYYVGTTSSLQVLTLSGGLKLVNTLREAHYVDSLTADRSGRVAAVSSDGRLFLMEKGQILSSRQIPGNDEVFRTCGFDQEGRLLGGTTGNRVFVYDVSEGYFRETDVLTCEGMRNLKDLYPLDSGEIFVTSDSGIGYLDAARTFHPVNSNDFNASIDNMLLDYQGNLWFTSSRLGLLRMAPSSFQDVYATVGMDIQVVNTVVRWKDGNYYIGTDKGLDIVDPSFRERIHTNLSERLKGSRIRCMLADSAGSLWICTYGGGLIEVTADNHRYMYNQASGSFGNRARLVAELKDGTIIAGGDTGISWFRDHQVIRTLGYEDGLINSMILSFTEMEDGRVLAGTDGDGIAVLENGQVTRMITRADGLSSGVILRTVKDPEAEAVFIVTSNGLCYMDTDGSIRTLDNFPYFNNYNIYFREDGMMFVMSSAGIYVIDRDELLSGTPDPAYDLLDGRRGLTSALTANSWFWDEPDGDLFLPCDTGVYIFNTWDYSTNALSYRMMISEIRMDGESFQPERGTEIIVPRDVARIEIHPEIINYTIQDPYVGYWLEGFDKGWVIQPQSSLSPIAYTNLAPGSYVFHIAVYDNSKQHIIAQRAYPMEKESAFYDSRGFLVYLVLVPAVFISMAIAVVMLYRSKKSLEKKNRQLAEARKRLEMADETILAIANTVDVKDERTGRHSWRVSRYARLMAEELGWSKEECDNVSRAARLHDIGKIGIPDNVLNKNGKLDDHEYAIMKSHTLRGAAILEKFTLIDHAAEGAKYHHERYDGRGYPYGLQGENIPVYGRLIGVADAFDAMTAARCYRGQMSLDYVIGELERCSGTQFDPVMAETLLKVIREGKINVEEMYKTNAEEEKRIQEEKQKAQAAGSAAEAPAAEAPANPAPAAPVRKEGTPAETGRKEGDA